MPKTRPAKPTIIRVIPGLEIVAQPGVRSSVIETIQSAIDDMRSDWVDDEIATLLGDHDDRYECSKVLRANPKRLAEIGKIIARAEKASAS